MKLMICKHSDAHVAHSVPHAAHQRRSQHKALIYECVHVYRNKENFWHEFTQLAKHFLYSDTRRHLSVKNTKPNGFKVYVC
jgi:hypothetical protein